MAGQSSSVESFLLLLAMGKRDRDGIVLLLTSLEPILSSAESHQTVKCKMGMDEKIIICMESFCNSGSVLNNAI